MYHRQSNDVIIFAKPTTVKQTHHEIDILKIMFRDRVSLLSEILAAHFPITKYTQVYLCVPLGNNAIIHNKNNNNML